MNNFSRNIFKKMVFCGLVLMCSVTFAANQDPAPVVMLKNTSNKMITELNKNLGHLKNNDDLVESIIKNTILSHFELVGMSQAVVGRNYWQQASSNLQRQFIHEFTDYVIRTYASAISSYDGETIRFYPIRGNITGQSRVQVNSDINHKDGPPIHVQYRVVNTGNAWLIYDFSVDGVSLVRNYQSQFASTLQQGGLSLLVKKLRENNASY